MPTPKLLRSRRRNAATARYLLAGLSLAVFAVPFLSWPSLVSGFKAGTAAEYLASKDAAQTVSRSYTAPLLGNVQDSMSRSSVVAEVCSYSGTPPINLPWLKPTVPGARIAGVGCVPRQVAAVAKPTLINAVTPQIINAASTGFEQTHTPVREAFQQQTSVALPLATIRVTAMRDKSSCLATSLNVVAHEDDDILFMNPDISRDIKAGRCIRTMYLTAGDSGSSKDYWTAREQGAKAAYAEMYGLPNSWRDQRELLADRFVSVSYLDNAPQVALVWLRLPDGNVNGTGFGVTGNQSLAQLLNGILPQIRTVDDDTLYTKVQLVALLGGMISVDAPDVVRSQNPNDPGDGDHSDHHAGAELVRLAAQDYPRPLAIDTYGGYPTMAMPINLTTEEVAAKQLTFLSYARSDGAVCQTVVACYESSMYGSFLTRQYKLSVPAKPVLPAPTP